MAWWEGVKADVAVCIRIVPRWQLREVPFNAVWDDVRIK